MNHRSERPSAPFTASERDLLRRELCSHFGQDPLVADGIFLRTWRAGEHKGQPKIPPPVRTMLDAVWSRYAPAVVGLAPSSPPPD